MGFHSNYSEKDLEKYRKILDGEVEIPVLGLGVDWG